MKKLKLVAGMLVIGTAMTVSYPTLAQTDNTNMATQADDMNDLDDDGADYGWIGLIGLAGLVGLLRKKDTITNTVLDSDRRNIPNR